MAVYFAPERKSWLDYAAPLVMQLLGSGMERTNQAKAYELAKRTEEEALARRQQEAQWRAERLYGVQKQRPLSGPEQALNVAAHTPGGRLPATEEAYREGGILNGMDMRGNPDDAFGRVAAGMQYMDPETAKQMQHMLGSLNPNMSFQAIDQGDRATAGAFDPSSGGFDGQEYMYGANPTKQYEADKSLEGILAQAAGNRDVARINAQGRGGRGQAAQLVTNPETGTLVYIAPGQEPFDTGIPAQQQQQQTQAGLAPEKIADMWMAYEKGREPVFGEPQPENPLWPFVRPHLPGGPPPAPQMMPEAGGNPFAGRLSDDAYRKARALGKSDAEIEAELKRLKR